jgi:hypothetical protein
MRYSVLLGVYSHLLVTVGGAGREVINGDVDAADPIWDVMQGMGKAARVVAFTFPAAPPDADVEGAKT